MAGEEKSQEAEALGVQEKSVEGKSRKRIVDLARIWGRRDRTEKHGAAIKLVGSYK